MDPNELKSFIRTLEREKDLDVSVVKQAIEEALVSVSKKNLSMHDEARAEFDIESGTLRLFAKKKVVGAFVKNRRTEVSLREVQKQYPHAQLGDEIEMEIDPADLGRIAAQAAAQVIRQRLKDAERSKVYDEFLPKKGEILSGRVVRFDKRDVILNVGKTEALLPRQQCPAGVRYELNFPLKVLLTDLDLEGKGPVLRVSRIHPNLVLRLFEQAVPEISDGTVKIVGVAREPGVRTKIAVQSVNPDVDPVGACVGVKGSRVQMVVQDLDNEKVDIIPFSVNPRDFIKAALVPAQIASVTCDDSSRMATVIVKEGNLSLAIGKRGQNAKLAGQLTGWKLEIHSEGEEEKRSRLSVDELNLRYLEDFLVQVFSNDETRRRNFFQSEFTSVEKIADADPTALAGLLDGSDMDSQDLIEQARYYLDQLSQLRQTVYGDDTPAEGAANAGGDAPVADAEPAAGEDKPNE